VTPKLRAAVLALLTTLGLIAIISPTAPAWACSCVSRENAEELADLTITGTVTAVSDRSVELAVDGVEKGSTAVGAPLTLKSGRYESSCGFGFRTGVRYRVNSVKGSTGLCLGVAEMPPLPVAVTSAPAVAVAVAPEPAPASTNRWWLVAGGGLTVLIAGLVTVAVRRRRTRACPADHVSQMIAAMRVRLDR
jgi:hypothetical protein